MSRLLFTLVFNWNAVKDKELRHKLEYVNRCWVLRGDMAQKSGDEEFDIYGNNEFHDIQKDQSILSPVLAYYGLATHCYSFAVRLLSDYDDEQCQKFCDQVKLRLAECQDKINNIIESKRSIIFVRIEEIDSID